MIEVIIILIIIYISLLIIGRLYYLYDYTRYRLRSTLTQGQEDLRVVEHIIEVAPFRSILNQADFYIRRWHAIKKRWGL